MDIQVEVTHFGWTFRAETFGPHREMNTGGRILCPFVLGLELALWTNPRQCRKDPLVSCAAALPEGYLS